MDALSPVFQAQPKLLDQGQQLGLSKPRPLVASKHLPTQKKRKHRGPPKVSCTILGSLAVLGWRPSLLGWRPVLLGWRPSLFGWRPSSLDWRSSQIGALPKRMSASPAPQCFEKRRAATWATAAKRPCACATWTSWGMTGTILSRTGKAEAKLTVEKGNAG